MSNRGARRKLQLVNSTTPRRLGSKSICNCKGESGKIYDELKTRAEKLARMVKGVRSVINNIVVKPE